MDSFSEDLRRAQGGDESALVRLWRRGHPVVDREVRCRLNGALRRRFDAADLSQSVFLEVIREIGRFEDRGEAAFLRWLRMKAGSKVRRKFRKVLTPTGDRREITGDGAEPESREPEPEADLLRREEEGTAARALARLPEGQRMAIELRKVEGLSHRQVAERLGLPSEDAARKLYARALLALRATWKTA